MDHIDRTWNAFIDGDYAAMLANSQYASAPGRDLAGLAHSLIIMGDAAQGWLDTTNARLDGSTPREVLARHDEGSWMRVARAASRPVDTSDIIYIPPFQ